MSDPNELAGKTTIGLKKSFHDDKEEMDAIGKERWKGYIIDRTRMKTFKDV